MDENTCCSTSSSAFGVVGVPYFGHSNWYVAYLIVVLICISQLTYDVEHLFIYLFAICISFFGEVSVQIFCPLFNSGSLFSFPF